MALKRVLSPIMKKKAFLADKNSIFDMLFLFNQFSICAYI